MFSSSARSSSGVVSTIGPVCPFYFYYYYYYLFIFYFFILNFSLKAYGPGQALPQGAHAFPAGVPVLQAQGVQVIAALGHGLGLVGQPANNQDVEGVVDDLEDAGFPVVMQLEAAPITIINDDLE